MTKYFEVEKPLFCEYRDGMHIYDDAYRHAQKNCGITGKPCRDDNKFPSWCILKEIKE